MKSPFISIETRKYNEMLETQPLVNLFTVLGPPKKYYLYLWAFRCAACFKI